MSFSTEPLPPDSPFWDLPNVFITPHLGGYTIEYEALIMPLIIDNMRAFLAGRQNEMRISSSAEWQFGSLLRRRAVRSQTPRRQDRASR